MDMFMDKLAQKFTSQEPSRNTTSTDTEDLKRMRNRVAEYNECLDKLQEILAQPPVQVDSTEVSDKIAAKLDASIHKECVKVYRNMQAVSTDLAEETMSFIGRQFRDAEYMEIRRNRLVLGFSIAAFALSLISAAGVVLLLLQSWNIKLF